VERIDLMSGQANEWTQVVLLSTSAGSFKYSLQLPVQRPIDQSGLPSAWLDQSRLKSGEKRKCAVRNEGLALQGAIFGHELTLKWELRRL
jgi:hypothetical protein